MHDAGSQHMIKGLVGTALAVAGVLLLGDRAADWAAERAVAGQLQRDVKLATAPDVDITGFPFLTQVASGRYRPILVEVGSPVVVDGTRVDRSSVVVRGARLPVGDLVDRNLDALRVSRTTVAAHLRFSEVERLVNDDLSGSGMRVRLSPASRGLVLVAAQVDTPVGPLGVQAPARVTVGDGRLRLRIPATLLDRLPAAARQVVSSLLDRSFPLPALGNGFRVTSADVDDDGVTVGATSRRRRLALP